VSSGYLVKELDAERMETSSNKIKRGGTDPGTLHDAGVDVCNYRRQSGKTSNM